MTTSNVMSLPVDIPWKRLATSSDMIDLTFGDSIYPPKWLTSLTIFYYEPPEEEQLYPDRTVTYLKVSCSIASLLIVDPADPPLGIDPKYLRDNRGYYEFQNKMRSLSQPCPCYGALLQVAVFPGTSAGPVDLEDYPIIMDFEPKKREMYESGVQNQLFMSSSRSSLSVKKSNKTVESQETSTSLSMSASASDQGMGGGFGLNTTNKFGTSYETVDTMSTDFSREKREDYSYTTNLTHMYHLLTSYHVGTNRAMFALQPRPRITDEEFVFFGGPLKLDGIQEFFLIIERPRAVNNLCVEATLETANVHSSNTYTAKIIPITMRTQPDYINKTAKDLNLKGTQVDAHAEELIYGGGNYHGWNNIDSITRDNILFAMKNKFSLMEVNAIRKGEGLDLFFVKDWYTIQGLKDLMGSEFQDFSENLEVIYVYGVAFGEVAVLGRTTAGCLRPDDVIMIHPKHNKPWLIGESSVSMPHNMLDLTVTKLQQAIAANCFSQDIADMMMESVSARDRLPYGEAGIQDARFVQNIMIEALSCLPDDDPYNVAIEEIQGIETELRAQLAEKYGVQRRMDALRIDMTELRTEFGLSDLQARRLRSQLIGEGPRFDTPLRSEQIMVPNVVGSSLHVAKRMLAGVGLVTCEPVYQDSLDKQDNVLNQYPNAGTMVKRGITVQLVASSGPVAIPNVVGMNIDSALSRLEEYSLGAEHVFVASTEQPEGNVIETTPAANIKVPRNSKIVLMIARLPDQNVDRRSSMRAIEETQRKKREEEQERLPKEEEEQLINSCYFSMSKNRKGGAKKKRKNNRG